MSLPKDGVAPTEAAMLRHNDPKLYRWINVLSCFSKDQSAGHSRRALVLLSSSSTIP
jgi:hypothetical protein